MKEKEELFIIKAYLKVELAQMYHPHLPPRYAMSKMRSWIRQCPELHKQLYAMGEGRNDHAYTRRQVKLIVEYLDVP